MSDNNLSSVAINILSKTILAADESSGTIKKRFDSIGIESTPEKNREYRQLLFTSAGIEKYVSGVILYDETVYQKSDDNTPLPSLLANNNINPGIKVDRKTISIPGYGEDTFTQGLDDLGERLAEYLKNGCVFAKWRALYTISDESPSKLSINRNSQDLALYALICQSAGIVPIVEPEILMDGNHSLEKDKEITEKALAKVFEALIDHKVDIKSIILKPNMITSGSENKNQASIKQVAQETLDVLQKTVPAEVPGIAFLSGGQSPELATQHLNEINKIKNQNVDKYPWRLTASFGRALQGEAIEAWGGKKENTHKAQEVFIARAKKVYSASLGQL
ncbi:MAG: class I fructose-bisphosphate aldolase [Patescibacteria group bacterium]